MQYQVERACAAGGYTSLYLELDLLPDVAIAEEARDNRTSGQAIYESIINNRPGGPVWMTTTAVSTHPYFLEPI